MSALNGEGAEVPSFYLLKKRMSVEQRVIELAEEKLQDREDLFIVSVKVQNKKITLLLDGDNGVTIEDCAKVSRHVGFHLEEEDLMAEAYQLEVGSAGLDAELVLDRQFQKNIGRNLLIKKKDGSKIDGKLVKADPDSLVISHEVKEKGKKAQLIETTIEKENIASAKVSISFK